jgi:transcriptional regulator with XRE-family HTH domain
VATYEGISPQYLSELERGVKQPSSWQLLANLARRYGCSIDYLLGLNDDAALPPSSAD